MRIEFKDMIPAARKETKFFDPTAEQLKLIKDQICKDLTDAELALALEISKQRGLNPILGQIHFLKRKSKNPKTGQWEEKMTIQTAIDGFLLIAGRTGQFRGQKTWTTGDLKQGTLKGHAIVYRLGHEASEVEIDFEEFCQRASDGELTYMWKKMPKWMIQKVALARCLDRSFPEDLSGLYTNDEMPPIETSPMVISGGTAPASSLTTMKGIERAKPAKRNTRPTKSSKVEFVEADPFAPSGDFQAIPPDYVPLEVDSLPGDEVQDADYSQEQPMPLDDPWQHQLEANIFGADGTAYKGMTLKQIGVGRLKYIFKTEEYKKLLSEADVVNMVECLASPSDTGLLHTNIAHRNDPDYLMPFGKHKGQRVADIEPSYFTWLQDNKPELLEKFSDLKEWLRTNAE